MTDTLKPCPWCRSVNAQRVTSGYDGVIGEWVAGVHCFGCGCDGPITARLSEGRAHVRAKMLWNERIGI